MTPQVVTGPRGGLLVAGSASGVGKSTVAAALCRSFARRNVRVAPFKAQNMSNHAAVTSDGGEIGRAQAMQALAARVEATVDMNPILIKPGPDMTSHVVVRGREIGTMQGFEPLAENRKQIVLDSYQRVAERHDLVIAEGAGGAAEINLLDRDLVNLPFAEAAGLPAILVVDIDRGGAFASAYGTVKILPPRLSQHIQGIVLNSFRGDPKYLGDGLSDLAARTGVPVLGVLPHLGPTPLLGVEDSLDIALHSSHDSDRLPTLRVAVIALPHLANPSDFDPLAMEPDVAVAMTRRPADVLSADLVIIPGSRATVADLGWMRSTGLAAAVAATDAAILGICGGYQMLGRTIDDLVESKRGLVDGLGMLDVETVFDPSKVVQQSRGTAQLPAISTTVMGYQIRYGRPGAIRDSSDSTFLVLEGEPEGAIDRTGRIFGTSLHGVFDDDDFRASFLANIADHRGHDFSPGTVPFAQRVDDQHERLADWVEDHLQMDLITAIADTASPAHALPGWHGANIEN